MSSKSIGLLTMVFGADMKGFDKAMRKAEKSVTKFGKNMQKMGANMTRNITLPLIAIGGAAAKLSMDFETSMTKINTLVGVSASEVKQMKKEVLDLAGETATAPKELADALFFLTSAGLRGANAMDTLRQVAKGTASGLGDMESLSRTVAAAQNAYGVETINASEALDVFGGMVQTGMFKSEELAAVLGTNLGLAANLGISFDEVGAFIATYTKTTGDANAATTGLGATMMSLAKITPIQERALEKINLSADGVRKMLGEQGLQNTLMFLNKEFKNNNIQLSEFFTKSNALKGVMGVLGNQTETYVDILDDLKQKQGFVDDAFNKTAETAGFKLSQAFATLKSAGVEFGDTLAPTIKSIASEISRLSNFFKSLSISQKEMLFTMVKYVAILGPALSLLGKMVIVGKNITTVFRILGATFLKNPMLSIIMLTTAAAIKLGSVLFNNATTVKRAEEAAAQRSLRVKTKVNQATGEQIKLLNKHLSIARNSEASEKNRGLAVKFLNKEVRGLNGQLTLQNINTLKTSSAVKEHTEALIQNAKAVALKDELANAMRDLSQFETNYYDTFRQKIKFALDASGMNLIDATSWAEKQMKNMTEELELKQKAVDTLAKSITEATLKGSKLTDPKTFDEIQSTKYADSINGLNEKLSDLNTIFNETEESSENYNKIAKSITNTQDSLNKKYEITSSSLDDIIDNTKDLNAVLFEEKTILKDLIESGASQKKLEDQANKIKIAQDKVNAALKTYNDLVDNQNLQGFEALEDAVNKSDKKLKDAIATGEDYKQLLIDYKTAVQNLKEKQDLYNDSLDKTTEDKLPAFIQLIEKAFPKFKIFGKSLSTIFEESGESISKAIGMALEAFSMFNNQQSIMIQNKQKQDEQALDERLRSETEAINKSSMSEEQRLRAIAILEGDVASERVAIEEKAAKKLNQIKKRQAIADKAIAIAQIIQNTAAGMMKAYAQTGIFGGPIAAGIIGALGAAQIALVASTPIPLAQGGIVSGPTHAIVGDNVGAGSGNPEVVAPLNKLKDMIGGNGTQRIQIFGRLTGNDIYLSNESESINRLRTT